MADYKSMTTEELIASNKSEYDNYKEFIWNEEITVGEARSRREAARRIENDYIVPALRNAAAEYDNGYVKFQNSSVRVEGNKLGYIVISLTDGKVVFHTDWNSYPQIKQSSYDYNGEKIANMIVNG